MEKPTVWIIESFGVFVIELEKLREDEHFVYARIHGTGGRGSGYPKYWSRYSKAQAYADAAVMLEERAREHREIAAMSK